MRRKGNKRMKNLKILFISLTLVLSHLACMIVAYNYRDILCGMEHAGYSAPPELALIYGIPFALGAGICALLAFYFHRRSK